MPLAAEQEQEKSKSHLVGVYAALRRSSATPRLPELFMQVLTGYINASKYLVQVMQLQCVPKPFVRPDLTTCPGCDHNY